MGTNMKSSPTMTTNYGLKIIYKQVSYIDRYFFMYYKKELVSKVRVGMVREGAYEVDLVKLLDIIPVFDKKMKDVMQIHRFLQRVKAHDQYLDSCPGNDPDH